jgi:hypothetical protein
VDQNDISSPKPEPDKPRDDVVLSDMRAVGEIAGRLFRVWMQ